MDEIDLTHAELYADSNRGQFIPQFFAQSILREHVAGVTESQFAALEAGPDAEDYWDVWNEVQTNAVITDKEGRKWSLYQDGDLWMIPDEDASA